MERSEVMMKLLKQAQRYKVAEAQRERINSVPNNSGFSFMELMVVVAIVAILIVASMPLFRSFARGSNIKNGAVTVMSALKKTREASITYRKNYKTVLDTVNQAVAIYYSDDTLAENWQKLPEFVEFDTNPAHGWSVPYNFGGGFEWVEFKPDGGAKLGGTIVLIEESTSDTRKITFTNITGRIKIE